MTANARPQDVQQVRHALGLDQPLGRQYVNYLRNLAHGDLGRSFQTNESVAVQIRQRYPATIQLAFGAKKRPSSEVSETRAGTVCPS